MSDHRGQGNEWMIFAVPSQDSGTGRRIAVKITSFKAEEAVNRYLSMMRKSEEALKNLIAYFQQVEEPTVIVVFGDHQPHFSQAFYYRVMGKIDSQMSQEYRPVRRTKISEDSA